MLRLVVLLGALLSYSCAPGPGADPDPCSEQWFPFVERKLVTGDSDGHGPDIGSLEWRSVVEFKLGIRGDSSIPDRATTQWCTYIDERLPRS